MCWELPKLPEVKAHRSKVSVGVHLLLLGSADYDGPTRLLRDLPSNVYCYDPADLLNVTDDETDVYGSSGADYCCRVFVENASRIQKDKSNNRGPNLQTGIVVRIPTLPRPCRIHFGHKL